MMRITSRIQLSHIKSLLAHCEKGNAAVVRLGRQNAIVNLVTLFETNALEHLPEKEDDHLLEDHFTMNLISSAPNVNDSDREFIRAIVELRNSIVHGDGTKRLSVAEVRECLKLADRILNKDGYQKVNIMDQRFAKFLIDDSLKAFEDFEKKVDEIKREEKLKNRRMIKWFMAAVCILLLGWSLLFLFIGHA